MDEESDFQFKIAQFRRPEVENRESRLLIVGFLIVAVVALPLLLLPTGKPPKPPPGPPKTKKTKQKTKQKVKKSLFRSDPAHHRALFKEYAITQ